MVQFASFLRRFLCKTRLIFPRISGPNFVIAITSGFAVVAVLGLNIVAIEVSFVGVPVVCVGAFCSVVDDVGKSVNDTAPIKGICGLLKSKSKEYNPSIELLMIYSLPILEKARF